MATFRFTFVDDASGRDAELAAAILAQSLRRQGYESRADQGAVFAVIPESDHPGLTHIVIAMAEELVAGAGADPDTVIVCSARPACTVRDYLGLIAPVATVDAAGIAVDEGADPVIALLGGAARAIPQIDHDTLASVVWATFDRQLPYAAHAAVRALDTGYRQTQFAS